RLLLITGHTGLFVYYQLGLRVLISTLFTIYTLSLHDALPISRRSLPLRRSACTRRSTLRRSAGNGAHATTRRSPLRRPSSLRRSWDMRRRVMRDRKSTRLNSSHVAISYAVFCLKKKNEKDQEYENG